VHTLQNHVRFSCGAIHIMTYKPKAISMVRVKLVRVDALTSSTQKFNLEEGSQSTYTLQHSHSHVARETDANAAKEKGANMKINGWRHK
jgi:hypothetical protein